MPLLIPDVLTVEEVAQARVALAGAAWVDGRGTAGHLSMGVKHNTQLHWQDPVAVELGAMITARLERHPMFLSAALPHAILPPLFNRYTSGGHYGPHIDGAIRQVDGTRHHIRTDLSLTLALSDPQDYDGGELVIADHLGERTIKLPAGHAVLYPASSIHHVTPVTRGERLAAFTWVQSMVRGQEERDQLFDLDLAIQQLPDGPGLQASRLRFTNLYHNLLRRWAEL
jgi:PKHD-type hydroxylase